MITSIKLQAGGEEMILLPRDDLRVQALDVPLPEPREVTEPRTGDDGERDTTQYYGATSCTLELLIIAGPEAVCAELDRYMHPRTRPYLVVADDEWPTERRLRLRPEQRNAPRGVDLPPTVRRVQAQWRVPDGVWEAAEQQVVTFGADLLVTEGRSYPKTYPKVYAATLASGATLLTNPGNVPSHFTVRLYGPCEGPRLINQTTGHELTFGSGLVLGAGEYVEINTRGRTAYLLSTGPSLLRYLDYTASHWWRIEPGDNQVRYLPVDAEAGAAAEITYRPAWL